MTFSYGNSINSTPDGGITPPATSYLDLSDKPLINGNILTGNQTPQDLGFNADAITTDTTGFQILTGKTIQEALNQLDKLAKESENRNSLLRSLDPLDDKIDGMTSVPLSSLEAIEVDGRPSYKEAGADVYDDFGTFGIVDRLDGNGNAIIRTMISRENRESVVIYPILKSGTNQYYIDVTPAIIRTHFRRGQDVKLSFEDTITQTGEQIYTFETFDKQNYAVFRRNVIEETKAERINIKVDFRGFVEFKIVKYNGVIFWVGTSSEYNTLEKQNNTLYRTTDTNEVFLGEIKLSV